MKLIVKFNLVLSLVFVVAFLLAGVFTHALLQRNAKAEIEENAVRITGWLLDNSAEFAQNGVSERSLARGAGMSTEQARTVIDRLESREVVVRDPVALTDPPHILIRPGRSWTSTRDKLAGSP